MQYLKLTDLIKEGFLGGKKVFIRSDLNVPRDNFGKITDDSRIRSSLDSIEEALFAGAAVMVTSHLGRPKEGIFDSEYSMYDISIILSKMLNKKVIFLKDWIDGVDIKPGQIILLENCRFNKGEKINCEFLSKKIANLCDIFVNDAFGSAHRKEASTFGIAKFAPVVCAGILMTSELQALKKVFENPQKPLIALVGGSKVSTKLTVLKSLALKVDKLIVGGGIANTFLLSLGFEIGKSIVEKNLVSVAKDIIDLMEKRNSEIPIPIDVICSKNIDNYSKVEVKLLQEISPDDLILDIGPKTIIKFNLLLKKAKTILWNGPVGVFEIDKFANGTKILAESIADSSAFSLAGGGDTLAAIKKYDLKSKINYISTGGGAFLEFLEGKELPAVKILQERMLDVSKLK